ncbi:hypothetical protein [Streptomyces mesophilus]|uniref:hypothetical protein n=1 Tax=Streptomyces mesophilus TaxID=1775132 RepID=UPI00331F3F5A
MCFGSALRHTSPVTDAISCSVPVGNLGEGRAEEIVPPMERTRWATERMAPVDLSAPDRT